MRFAFLEEYMKAMISEACWWFFISKGETLTLGQHNPDDMASLDAGLPGIRGCLSPCH